MDGPLILFSMLLLIAFGFGVIAAHYRHLGMKRRRRAMLPARRTLGPSAHQTGSPPSQTAVGVQAKD